VDNVCYVPNTTKSCQKHEAECINEVERETKTLVFTSCVQTWSKREQAIFRTQG